MSVARRAQPAALLCLAALLCFAACGGKTTTASDAGTPPAGACTWSTTFEPIDAAPMADSCRATRAFLHCEGSDGSGVFCLTDKAACDTLPSHPPNVTYTCSNICKTTEFGATCGTIMGSSVQPPADCR